jgi:lipoprotein-anchoring transpeptidase ErfK/SrfK
MVVMSVKKDQMMRISRRDFVGSVLSSGLLLSQTARSFAARDFPVDASEAKKVDYKYQMREMDFETAEPAGTVVIDGTYRFLYLVLGGGKAIRYGVAVGKSTHAWTGEVVIKKMAEWPTWTPAPYHIATKPSLAKYLPGGMPGGPENPLGARAMYLFKGNVDTINRIHGSAKPGDIGKKATAGCIGMLNVHIVDLYQRVQVGTRVIML